MGVGEGGSSRATRASRASGADGEEAQPNVEDAISGLSDMVAGMNIFVEDTRAGPDGAEVEAVGGDVEFDVEKFMSLLSGQDLRWVTE